MNNLNSFENFLIKHRNKFYLLLLPGFLIIYIYPFMWKALLVIIVFGIEGILETLTKIENKWERYLKFYHNVLSYIIIPLPILFYLFSFFIDAKILKIPYMVITMSLEGGVKFLSSNAGNLILFIIFLLSMYSGLHALFFYILKLNDEKMFDL